MSDDERPTGPTPVGPLGAAMAALTDDTPAADFTAWSVIGEVRRRRSVRRQVVGGLAAGVAAIGVLVTVGLVVVGGGGSDSAATSASGPLSSSAASSSAAGSASSSAAATASGTSTSAAAGSAAAESSASGLADATETAPTPSVLVGSVDPGVPAAPSAVPGREPTDTASSTAAGCSLLPLPPEQLALIADRLPRLTAQTSCTADDVELGVQDYTVDAAPGVTLRAEVRAGAYDPCADAAGTVCVDDGSGVFSTQQTRGAATVTLVWVSGRAGSTVLTLTVPVGAGAPFTVAQLAAVVAELAATR